MAEIEDIEEEEEPKPKKGSGSISPLKLIIILALIGTLMIGVSIGVTLYLTGGLSGGEDEVAEVEEEAEEESKDKKSKKGKKGKSKDPAIYLKVGDPFTVNFANPTRARFLQVTVEAMTRDPEIESQLATHMPVIRNNLVLLFSSQEHATISTREGKEKLRQEALKEIQSILKSETGDKGIEALYFTSFVMQ